MKNKKIAVLASGNGSNFEVLVKSLKKSNKAKITLLIVNKKHAFAQKRAKKLGIRSILVEESKFKSRVGFDKALLNILCAEKIDIVLLGGYMRILTPQFIKKYKNRIINIHPALLPAFRGTNSIKKAYNYGCKLTGVTLHFVDEYVDHGPIIKQESIPIRQSMTLTQLTRKIHALEHKMYPQIVKNLIDGRIKVHRRKVSIR